MGTILFKTTILESGNDLAPIVLFVYNRPWHTRQTLEALEKNELASESSLFIYADGPKQNASTADLIKINEVRHLIHEKLWCKSVEIIESDVNKGLAESIISGVTEIIHRFGKIIVLEDDLVTGRGFLRYMNDALYLCQEDLKVMQVSGYQFPLKFSSSVPTYFYLPMTTSWGWATWKRAWDLFDFNASGWYELKKQDTLRKNFDLDNSYPYSNMLEAQMEHKTIDSWAIRWWWTVFKLNGVTLFPKTSFIKNIGFDEFSTHTKRSPFKETKLNKKYSFKELTNMPRIEHEAFKTLKIFLKMPNDINRTSRISNLFNRVFKSLK